jgi:uncharacterized protein with HEPN domain
MTNHDDRVYLEHILECAALIRDYTRNGKAEFIENILVRDAVLRRLQIMAESTQRLSGAPIMLRTTLGRMSVVA